MPIHKIYSKFTKIIDSYWQILLTPKAIKSLFSD